jgi:hypothetical protein
MKTDLRNLYYYKLTNFNIVHDLVCLEGLCYLRPQCGILMATIDQLQKSGGQIQTLVAKVKKMVAKDLIRVSMFSSISVLIFPYLWKTKFRDLLLGHISPR